MMGSILHRASAGSLVASDIVRSSCLFYSRN